MHIMTARESSRGDSRSDTSSSGADSDFVGQGADAGSVEAVHRIRAFQRLLERDHGAEGAKAAAAARTVLQTSRLQIPVRWNVHVVS